MPIIRFAALGLQTKIIFLVILIVSTVLFVSTGMSLRTAARSFDEDVKEQGLLVAQGLAAAVGSARDLDDPLPLRREVEGQMRPRGNIKKIAVFAVRAQDLVPVVLSDREAVQALSGVAQASVTQGRTVAVQQTSETGRVWGVATPIKVGETALGAVGVEVSLKRADVLAASQARQSMEIMGMAAVIIVGFLGWYLHRNVNRPIHALVKTMARAERGDLAAKVDLERQDELGRLAESFNRMLERVANFNQELRLEVEQATRELADRNEELTKLNDRLFDTQRDLIRSNRLAAVGQLAAMVAHEVGTPLNAISGHVEILLHEEQENEGALHRLRIIESQIARVVEILQRMLTASHPGEREFEPVDVNAMVMDLLRLTRPAIDQNGVKVDLDLDPGLPRVRGDAGQLQQICLNLIMNGLEAMPDGGRLIVATRRAGGSVFEVPASRRGVGGAPDVRLRVGTVKGGFAEISVSDTGEGIPPEHLNRIFAPFFTTKGVGRGTGLGLAICQRIVKTHGGTMTVTSHVGRGSTFTIVLPMDPEGAR